MTVQRRVKTTGKVMVEKKVLQDGKMQTVGSKMTEVPVIPRATYHGPTANVGYSASMTKNIDNYENVKVNVSLNLPIAIPLPTELDAVLDQAFSYVTDWVDQHMAEVLTELDTKLAETTDA